MELDILICTFNDKINNIKNIILEEKKGIYYKISHQITEEKYRVIPKELIRDDIKISVIYGKGLSKNRNNSLKMADKDICLISDDDVTYKDEYFDRIIEEFEKNFEADILTFKIKVNDSEREYKKYKIKQEEIKKIEKISVSSIEIAFKRKSINKFNIQFDEKFGLGSCYPRGEEKIFLQDCLKSKLKIEYIPKYVVEHPYESSTKNKNIDLNYAITAGAITKRLYKGNKLKIIGINIFSTIILYKKYHKNGISFFKFFKYRINSKKI